MIKYRNYLPDPNKHDSASSSSIEGDLVDRYAKKYFKEVGKNLVAEYKEYVNKRPWKVPIKLEKDKKKKITELPVTRSSNVMRIPDYPRTERSVTGRKPSPV